ncbi:hypothetical protein HDG34_000449 [Paraburkholderia sp. HC6.4b]|uniref:hypothetical protein n=1 Tax=unclassified Paraburkholderia TaxID=2615204 RepID=UPI00161BD91A|nr:MULTISPECIES: hypothetical protein [unclassified Paraburkholderia]MBB5406534.1 hypothetical protein [Paraburkholderia sp. HC6.4b]MBB5448932.1 hypothetical protein [Paraburkholderia sp. Kb1A]MBC8724101.1 hypothetical protein [Paraburkholderia sp. 31.1]
MRARQSRSSRTAKKNGALHGGARRFCFRGGQWRAKKSRLGGRANDTSLQRIGAFGSSNRISGNGTTLLLAITPAQRIGWAGVKDDARHKALRVDA